MKIFLLSSLILLNTAWVQAENKTKSYSNANSNSKVGGICKPILSGMKVSVFTFSQSERFVREFQGTKETQIQTVESYIAEFRLGDPSQEYGRMMSLRLNRANNLIKNGKTISEASLLVGFNDQSHFTRNFKKYFGYTPTLLQKNSNIIL